MKRPNILYIHSHDTGHYVQLYRNETHNLAHDLSKAEVLDGMRGRLDRWMQATDDPLLCGPVPAPIGARINDPDGLSPNEATIVVTRDGDGDNYETR